MRRWTRSNLLVIYREESCYRLSSSQAPTLSFQRRGYIPLETKTYQRLDLNSPVTRYHSITFTCLHTALTMTIITHPLASFITPTCLTSGLHLFPVRAAQRWQSWSPTHRGSLVNLRLINESSVKGFGFFLNAILPRTSGNCQMLGEKAYRIPVRFPDFMPRE